MQPTRSTVWAPGDGFSGLSSFREDKMDIHAIMANFHSTITRHYFDMKGRVARGRFWYFIVASIAVEIIGALLQAAFYLPIASLVILALLPPTAGMGARRLQDTGRNGNLVWIFIVPVAITQVFAVVFMGSGPLGLAGMVAFYLTIGWILNLISLIAALVLLYYWSLRGDFGANAYGNPPDHSLVIPTPSA